MTIYDGQEKEYAEIQAIQEALLSINGSLKRVGVNTSLVEIILPSEDFTYISLVIENTDEHKFKKFYHKINDKSFMLSNIRIIKGGF